MQRLPFVRADYGSTVKVAVDYNNPQRRSRKFLDGRRLQHNACAGGDRT